MTWFEPSVGCSITHTLMLYCRTDVHFVADIDLRPIVVRCASSGQQAVCAAVCRCRRVGQCGIACTRTPPIETAILEGGGDSRIVLLARIWWRRCNLADHNVADIERIRRAARLEVERQASRWPGEIAEAEGSLHLCPRCTRQCGGGGKIAEGPGGGAVRRSSSTLSLSDYCCQEPQATRTRSPGRPRRLPHSGRSADSGLAP